MISYRTESDFSLPLIINSLKGAGPFSILVRHAERQAIENVVNNSEIGLTKKGEEHSFEFGKSLSILSPIEIFHGPSDRCMQTAKFISKGILMNKGGCRIKGDKAILGGFYNIDNNSINQIIEKHGLKVFVRKWFNEELPEDIILSVKQAAKNELQEMIDQLDLKEASFINITHGRNIAILREWLFGRHNIDLDPVYPLDGIVMYMEKDKRICLLYHEQKQLLKLPL